MGPIIFIVRASEHKFIPGKPEIEEKITEIKPNHSTIGPKFKKESKRITKWIKENQETLINKIKKEGDIKWSDIPILDKIKTNEKLIENDYIKIIKRTKIKGEKDRGVIKFDDFYIEVPPEMIK